MAEQVILAVTVVRLVLAEQVVTIQLKLSKPNRVVHILYVLADLGDAKKHILVVQVWDVVHMQTDII